MAQKKAKQKQRDWVWMRRVDNKVCVYGEKRKPSNTGYGYGEVCYATFKAITGVSLPNGTKDGYPYRTRDAFRQVRVTAEILEGDG